MRVMVLLVLLAGCGAGDAPFSPPQAHGQVAVSNHGVETSGTIESTNGTLTIGVGF